MTRFFVIKMIREPHAKAGFRRLIKRVFSLRAVLSVKYMCLQKAGMI